MSHATLSPLPASRLSCSEVRGGNHVIHDTVELPGLRGLLYSSPCAGARGGDVHFLSVCGSGLLARVCLADIAGHGDTLAAVGAEMHAHLRRSVDTIDERRVLASLDRRLSAEPVHALTTAAVLTYYPPARRLTISYAGHPRGWWYRAATREWMRLEAGDATPGAGPLVDLPLATGLSPTFARRKLRTGPGDRVLLVTDGVIEAPSPEGDEFGADGVFRVLERHHGPCEEVGDALLAALLAHSGRESLTHDDVTFFLGEFVDGPAGPALWHVVRNRMLRPLLGV
ncbi:MAG: serine/threonine-protein phosphatase [Acidobacteria bacterium]|nr:serine/threonine-protein phosphatase [Acidobacteriota bacterium]